AGDHFAQRRAAAVQKVFAAAGAGRDDLLGEVGFPIGVASWSYAIFLVCFFGLIPGLVLTWLGRTGIFLGVVTPLVGLAVSWLLPWFGDARMDATFSGFWHDVRPNLRDAFRRVREEEREPLAKLSTPPSAPPAPASTGIPLIIGDRPAAPA